MSVAPKLGDSLHLGPVHLVVTDLDRAVGFYGDAIGLEVNDRGDGVEATMGAGGEDLLHLIEVSQAKPAGRHAGLYHFAVSFIRLARSWRGRCSAWR